MIGEHVPAARLAPLAIARGRLVERTYAFRALRHLNRIRFPQRERIHRRRRPLAAGVAVAITHGDGRSGRLEAHGAAETASFVALLFHARSSRVDEERVSRHREAACWPRLRDS